MADTVIPDPADWRAGDKVRIEWPNGNVFTGTVESNGGDLLYTDTYTVRYMGAAWDGAGDGRTTTVTRPALTVPTEPNTILLDIVTVSGIEYPLGRVNGGGELYAYDASGWSYSVAGRDIASFTPAKAVPA